jgi:hypothetical protein
MGDPRPVVIDLSNICCDRRLDDAGSLASWVRFELLLEALAGHLGAEPVWTAVADDSLERKLPRDDRRQLRDALETGSVTVADGDADHDLLVQARRSNAIVVSNDRFVDYRREQEWIDGNTDDFLGWVPQRGGGLRVVPRDMGFHTGFSISRAAEKALLKDRGLLRRRDGREWIVTDVLADRYRCVNPSCLAAKLAPDDIGIPQREPDGTVVCPSCRQPVEANGPRPRGLQLKLLANGREERLPVYEGQPLTLGRGRTSPDGADPSLLLDEDERSRISREHVEVALVGDRLKVTDLGSTGGTQIRRWSREGRAHRPAQQLAAGVSIELGERDQLVLAQLVAVERSGQRFGAR